MHVVEDFLN